MASRVTAAESRMSRILQLVAAMSTTVANNAKLQRRITRLEHQLTARMELKKRMHQQRYAKCQLDVDSL